MMYHIRSRYDIATGRPGTLHRKITESDPGRYFLKGIRRSGKTTKLIRDMCIQLKKDETQQSQALFISINSSISKHIAHRTIEMYPEIRNKRIFFKSVNSNSNSNLKGFPTNCLLYIDDMDMFNFRQRNIILPMIDKSRRCVISFTNIDTSVLKQNNFQSLPELDDLLIYEDVV